MNKSEQLIACLEGEIAKRDARIVGLESQYQRDVCGLNNEGDPIGGDPAGWYANDNARLRSELAAIKAQGVVMPDRDAVIRKAVGMCNRIPGSTTWNAAEFAYDELADRLNAAPVQQVSVPDDEAVMAKARELFGWAYGLGGFSDAVRDLVAFAAPAAPAADAGLVEALCKVEQALDLIGGIRHGKNVTQDELWQSCELLDAALAAYRAKGVV